MSVSIKIVQGNIVEAQADATVDMESELTSFKTVQFILYDSFGFEPFLKEF